MYAIVEIGGKQFKVEADKYIYAPTVNSPEGEQIPEGENVTFDNVLLSSDNEGNVSVGTPTTGNTIVAKVLEHVRADKVIVFKKKRRKGYKVKNGHRQGYTKLLIEKID